MKMLAIYLIIAVIVAALIITFNHNASDKLDKE